MALGVVVTLSLFAIAVAPVTAIPTPTDLGTLGGGQSHPAAMNAAGQVVGWSTTPDVDSTVHAFLWTPPAGPMQDLGGLGYASGTTVATGINDNSQVVGSSQTTSYDFHAFLWKNGVMTDLGTLLPDNGGESYASGGFSNPPGRYIDKLGQVVGFSKTSLGPYHAFRWQAGTGMKDLGTLGGSACASCDSYANAIGDNGWVVGHSSTASGAIHAFVWAPSGGGTMYDLGVLPGTVRCDAVAIGGSTPPSVAVTGWCSTSPDASGLRAFVWHPGANGMQALPSLGGIESRGIAISDDGRFVVGEITYASGATHAFLWQSGVGTTGLGTLPGGSWSAATAVTNVGKVVGGSGTGSGQGHGFLWQSGVMMDLGTLPGGTGSLALAINGIGQVAGVGVTSTGESHAVFWS